MSVGDIVGTLGVVDQPDQVEQGILASLRLGRSSSR